MNDGHAHIASASLSVRADLARRYLADPVHLEKWAIGTDRTELIGPNLVKGKSTRDGSDVYARIDVQEDVGAIYYFLGSDPSRLTSRIMIRIVSGSDLDATDGECVVSMIAWRLHSMDDARWQALMDTHEKEMTLIKTQIEAL